MNPQIEKLVRDALAEDLGGKGDITAARLIPKDATAQATIRARSAGVAAGLKAAEMVFAAVDPTLKIDIHAHNGAALAPGDILMTVEGDAAAILRGERTALNFLTHLSGIATLTRRYVDLIKGTGAKIYDTRKTTPGLRVLEKEAVAAGGGENHRFGLYDAVLIKDNHIAAAGGIRAALDKISFADGPVEIEVDTLAQLQEVLDHGGANIVLLDNMSVDELAKAVAMAKGKVILEASGGINLENARAVAQTGVDRISIGALTHSAPALDIGLDFNG